MKGFASQAQGLIIIDGETLPETIAAAMQNLQQQAHDRASEAGLLLGRLTPDGPISTVEGVFNVTYSVLVYDPTGDDIEDPHPEPT